MWLTSLPLWASGLLVVALPTALAMVGTRMVRDRVPLQTLRTNNEVAGFKFATVGVIYAVMVAFAVIVVWEKFSDAETDVAHEAGSIVNLYRVIEGMADDRRPALRRLVTQYVETAITKDWPAMAHGRVSSETTQALNALYAAQLAYTPTNAR
ncbi:MAG TPA: hypothetical protein VJ891_16395, partial [Casimicrobiaceae bacterium]|nr:hypothetical protein [Casimicrobiaceae bacterium]